MQVSGLRALTGTAILALLCAGTVVGQSPPSQPSKDQRPPVTDEFRAILKEIEEAYKAPREVDKDVLDELRKQYSNPTPEREAKIFKEIRRLYVTMPEQEQVILAEMRRAYQQPTLEQEDRIFREIRRGGQLPLGTVPLSIQAEQSLKLFRKLDQNGDGVLSRDEMPEPLQSQRAQWDRNGDGSIDYDEYSIYYQASLKLIAEGVAAGEIPLKLPKPQPPADAGTASAADSRPAARAAQPQPELPAWFTEYDLDGDGQVGLYEWRKKGGSIKDFLAIDRNNDGYITAAELRAFLAEKAATKSESKTRAEKSKK